MTMPVGLRPPLIVLASICSSRKLYGGSWPMTSPVFESLTATMSRSSSRGSEHNGTVGKSPQTLEEAG